MASTFTGGTVSPALAVVLIIPTLLKSPNPKSLQTLKLLTMGFYKIEGFFFFNYILSRYKGMNIPITKRVCIIRRIEIRANRSKPSQANIKSCGSMSGI